MKTLRLLRRNPDAPTLRERAASLRATVARLKRPRADELPEAGSQEARDAFTAACREDTRLSMRGLHGFPDLKRSDLEWWTRRTIQQALTAGELSPSEGARLYARAAQRELIFERASALTNVGALHILAWPEEYPRTTEDEDEDDAAAEHAIGFVVGDGTVSYRDAAGVLHTRPTASWINFTLQRLHAIAAEERSRQFNAAGPDLSEAECDALDARLERELRVSGLRQLAFGGRLLEAGDGPLKDRRGVERLVEEWRTLGDRINAEGSDRLADDAFQAATENHADLARAIHTFPAGTVAELCAKLPLFRDELEDAAGNDDARETLDVSAWRGLIADLERLSRALPALPLASGSDPVLEAIRQQRALYDALNATEDDDGPETDALSHREDEAWERLLAVRPTTAAGLLALVRALGAGSMAHTQMDGEPHLFALIADHLSRLMTPGMSAVDPEPVPCEAARVGFLIEEVSALIERTDGEDEDACNAAQKQQDALRDAISQRRARSHFGALMQVAILSQEAVVAGHGNTVEHRNLAADNVQRLCFSLAAFLRAEGRIAADSPAQRAFLPGRLDQLAVLDRTEA